MSYIITKNIFNSFPLLSNNYKGPVLFPLKTTSIAERSFSCEKCGKGYLHFRNLHRHRRLECGKQPAFSCSVCPYRAFQKVHVQKHMRRKHLQDLLPEHWATDTPPLLPAYLWTNIYSFSSAAKVLFKLTLKWCFILNSKGFIL